MSKNVILISGASSGIGRKLSLTSCRSGFTVYAGIRNSTAAEELKKECLGGVSPVQLDVTKADQISAVFEKISGEIEPQDRFFLINNAGIPLGGPLELQNMDEIRALFEVNLFGSIQLTQKFLPLLRRHRGKIVNMSSISGRIALPFAGPYAASKFALKAYSDSLRVELRPWKIKVILIEPGSVKTAIWDKASAKLEELQKNFPRDQINPYLPILNRREKFTTHGMKPEKIVRIVMQALISERPAKRYLIGKRAKILTVLNLLPISLRDWIISKNLPEYGGNKSASEKNSICEKI